ncbi:type II secretion system protein N [Thalassolituus marinus]|uniref:Type II secretion system protein N n=1 Tax=Thalassolituus marinus TaxID=671053 RepID=A0ABS7ZNL4_9GAMM|nr:type II secretion system protein N [Thalassolituus marinus]MCA6062657.1 type II secretion system protein N [Thalassolituus marinus]
MFKAIWAARWYVLLGLFTFLLILIATTPLHFVWRFAEPAVGRLPVKIEQLGGTLWNGQLRLQVPTLRSAGVIEGQWQLSPLSLFSASPQVHLSLSGDGIRFDGDARLSADQTLTLTNTSAYLDADVLEPLLKRNRTGIKGNFELNAVSGWFNLADRGFGDVAGQLLYSGGDVSFLVDRKTVNATMPMVAGSIEMVGDKAQVNIATMEGTQLIQAYAQQDGWGGVSIRRRFLDVLGQQWPAKADEDTVIFEVSHKIL